MIVNLEGTITKKDPTFLHLKLASGVTYGIFISLQTSALVKLDEIVSLDIKQIIREDANLLYGFLNSDEKLMFEALLKVNGVGSATAMAVCSTLSPKGFSDALANGSVDSFKKVPGIGPKTAKRILVDLSEFNVGSSMSSGVSPIFNEASLALESLGFKKEKINSVLKNCTATNTGELVKQALKKLS